MSESSFEVNAFSHEFQLIASLANAILHLVIIINWLLS